VTLGAYTGKDLAKVKVKLSVNGAIDDRKMGSTIGCKWCSIHHCPIDIMQGGFMSFLDRYARFPGSGLELGRSKVEIMRVKAIAKANKTKKGRKANDNLFMVSHLVSGISIKTTFRDWQDALNHVRELKSQNTPYRVYAYGKVQ